MKNWILARVILSGFVCWYISTESLLAAYAVSTILIAFAITYCLVAAVLLGSVTLVVIYVLSNRAEISDYSQELDDVVLRVKHAPTIIYDLILGLITAPVLLIADWWVTAICVIVGLILAPLSYLGTAAVIEKIISKL
jgi:hypothetical protein